MRLATFDKLLKLLGQLILVDEVLGPQAWVTVGLEHWVWRVLRPRLAAHLHPRQPLCLRRLSLGTEKAEKQESISHNSVALSDPDNASDLTMDKFGERQTDSVGVAWARPAPAPRGQWRLTPRDPGAGLALAELGLVADTVVRKLILERFTSQSPLFEPYWPQHFMPCQPEQLTEVNNSVRLPLSQLYSGKM